MPEWWVLLAVAGIGVIVSPLLDLTESTPDPIAGVVDAVFCVSFAMAARWPWAALFVYSAALATSFSAHEQESVLSAIALSSCVIVRVGSRNAILGLVAVLAGGLTAIELTGDATHGDATLIGIPFLALISSGVGVTLRLALGRERRLRLELQRRAQTEREIRAEERQVISDELHDDIAHDLTVILTYISVLEREYEEGNDADIRTMAMSVLGDTTRKVLGDLRLIIMDQGTAIHSPSARALSTAFNDARRELAGTHLDFTIDGDPKDPRVSRLVETALSRTLREAITNILKHGGQSPIHIGLAVVDDVVCFDIINALPKTRHEGESGFGTIRISERVQQLGGSCVIGPDGDTWLVSVRIPRHAVA